MQSKNALFQFLLLFLFLSCKNDGRNEKTAFFTNEKVIPVEYASGFSITDYGNFKIITVENPWPEAEKSFKYLLAEKGAKIPENLQFDQKVNIPVGKMVVTSTTHISSLEILGELKALIGFPGLNYISSEKARKLISEEKIKELGKNEAINTEILLNLKPDVVIGFAVDGSNKTLTTIQKSGIPVVYNSDWTENSPLGKAEWIKFFGAFFNKTKEAAEFFKQVETDYLGAKKLVENSTFSPTVLAGSMYKDQWFLPAGNSWHARFFKDANVNYLFSQTSGTGSITLSFESVLAKAKNADFWIGPAQFQSYREMLAASNHYAQFTAFQDQNIYTFSSEKGATGGVIFYELAPNRPDLVLKDLISIFHPELSPINYEPTFYKPLKP